MASFKELGDQLLVAMRMYTAELPVTDPQILYWLSVGMQMFQREALLVESWASLTRNSTTMLFDEPEDVFVPVRLTDSNGHDLLSKEFDELKRLQEQSSTGFMDSPYQRSKRVNYGGTGINGDNTMRLWARWNRSIYIWPDNGDTTLTLLYYPNLEAYSSVSTQWTPFFPLEVNFVTQYNSRALHPSLRPYERGVLYAACMEFLRMLPSPNYKVYEQLFYEEVNKAVMQKPLMATEVLRPYTII